MNDLSVLSEPTGTGFIGSARLSGEALGALALSQAQVDRFACDGFVGTDVPILTQRQLEQLRAELDALIDQVNPHPSVDLLHELHYNEAHGSGSVLFHCLGHWRISPGFHDILFLDSIGIAASQLLQGKSVRFWHDQAFVKPAGHGAVVQVCLPTCRSPPRLPSLLLVRAVAPGLFLLGPHRADGASHGPTLRSQRTHPPCACAPRALIDHRECQVHIALDDQTLENGALHWVPGSHRWTRDGGPLPQAAALAREKMARAKASGAGRPRSAVSPCVTCATCCLPPATRRHA
jgi:hypothetical protein